MRPSSGTASRMSANMGLTGSRRLSNLDARTARSNHDDWHPQDRRILLDQHVTPQPAKAREFFGKLLGWTYVEIPGIGHRIQVDGRDVGGIFDLASPNTPPGTPPLIGVMVKVDSADATVAKVARAWRHAMPAFDIMDQGRMAVCHDPNGAAFDVWEPKKSGAPTPTALATAPPAGSRRSRPTSLARRSSTRRFSDGHPRPCKCPGSSTRRSSWAMRTSRA